MSNIITLIHVLQSHSPQIAINGLVADHIVVSMACSCVPALPPC